MTITSNVKARIKAHTPAKLWSLLYSLRHGPRTGISVLPHFHNYRRGLVDHNCHFRWQDITLCVQNDYHANILLEDYLENGDYNVVTNRNVVVLDIGANIGDTPLYFAQRENVTRVYAYEPMPKTYSIARRNLDLNPQYASKIHLVNAGLGARAEDLYMPFDYPEGTGSASTAIINRAHQEYLNRFFPDSVLEHKGELVHILEASDVLRSIRRDHSREFLFVKCDCEGAEWSIFKKWEEDQLLKEIDALSMEFHFGSPSLLLGPLQENGFVCFLRGRDHMIMAVRR